MFSYFLHFNFERKLFSSNCTKYSFLFKFWKKITFYKIYKNIVGYLATTPFRNSYQISTDLRHLADDKLPPLVELAEAADLNVVLVNHPELEVVEVVEGADLVDYVETAGAVVAQDAVEGDRVPVKVVLVLLTRPSNYVVVTRCRNRIVVTDLSNCHMVEKFKSENIKYWFKFTQDVST